MRLVDVLLAAALNRVDTPTKQALAEKCRALPGGDGITPSVLSAYLSHDPENPDSPGRPIGPRHLAVLAQVLGGSPETLMSDIDDREVVALAEAQARIEQHRQSAAAAEEKSRK